MLWTLVDCGSSHSFLDSNFASSHGVPFQTIPPLWLFLLNGTSNPTITWSTTLSVQFSSVEILSIHFHLTLLNKSISAVLGYSWLSDYNPSIDWNMCSIQFQTTPLACLISNSVITNSDPTTPSTPLAQPEQSVPTMDGVPFQAPPEVSLINAAAFTWACKLPGSESYTMSLSDLIRLSAWS